MSTGWNINNRSVLGLLIINLLGNEYWLELALGGAFTNTIIINLLGNEYWLELKRVLASMKAYYKPTGK